MDKICRLCLEEGLLSSVFTKNYNITLCDMLSYCSNIKISKGDGLPEQLCSNCIYKLGIAYQFKQACESSDLRLREHLGIRIPNKYSDASIMTDPIAPLRTTIIKRCKCKQSQRKTSSNYKRKTEEEKQKRGPKPQKKPALLCSMCDKEFRGQAQLDIHIRTHTGDKPFACMHCPSRFSQKHNLTIHMRVHTGEKPYQCDVCSKTFSTQGNLQAHIKIHTGQKDFKCTVCTKSFITSSELTRHMAKHTGAKNYKCDMCPAAYVHQVDFRRHRLRKHLANSTLISDNYNNSSNIDIIGIDVGKDPPLPKEDIINLDSTKPLLPVIPEPSHPVLPYRTFNQNENKMFLEVHNCTICGDSFEYMTALAQHYLHKHKNHETLAS